MCQDTLVFLVLPWDLNSVLMDSSHVLRMQLCGAGLAATAVGPAHTRNPPAQEQLQQRGGRTAGGSCSGEQPALGSCSLLHSWRRGEGGYSLARPAAPPLVGNLRNPPSQSLPNVSRFEGLGKFFSLVSRESGLLQAGRRRRRYFSAVGTHILGQLLIRMSSS